jgi:hypothetical protein
MKSHESPAEVRAARLDYLSTRWTQYSQVSTSFGEEAIKYLLVVNTAALGASLGFLGAMPHLRDLQWPRTALFAFAFGVAVLGIYHALRLQRVQWLFKLWRNESNKYARGQIEWNDLIDGDEARSKKLMWLQGSLAYSSLLSFYIGLGIAGFNFDQVAGSPRSTNDRPQTHGSALAPSKTGAKPDSSSDSGQIATDPRKNSRP